MDRPTFDNCRRELPLYEAEMARIAEKWPRVRTRGGVDRLQHKEYLAAEKLADALYEDTKDRSTRADCSLVPAKTIKAWVNGEPRP